MNLFKTACTIILLGLFSSEVSAQTAFVRTMGGSKGDNNYALKRTPEGGYISVGYTESFGTSGKDILLIKTNSLGEVLWSKAYGGSGDDTGWGLTVAPDSGYVIAGTTNSNSNSTKNALVMKTDKDGKVDWSIAFSSDSIEDAYNVINSRQGGYYVTGYVRTDTTFDDAFVTRIDKDGKVLWYSRYGSPGMEEAYGIAEDRNGNIILSGMTSYDSITNGGLSGSPGTTDMFMAKLQSNGKLIWMKTFGSPDNDVAWDIIAQPDRYAMTGWSRVNNSDNNAVLIVTDTTGQLMHSRHYGSFGGEDRAFKLISRPGSEYALVGYTNPMGIDRSVLWLDIDKNAKLNNFQMYGAGERDGHWPTDVVLDGDGGFTILSTSRSFNAATQDDWLMMKVGKDGSALCFSQLDFIGEDSLNVNSRSFGISTPGYRVGNLSLTTTDINTLDDSTLCCRLKALVSDPDISICEGEQIALGEDSIPGYLYTWTSDKGFTSNRANPLIRPTVNDTYKLVVAAADKACTKDSATVKVTVVSRQDFPFVQDTSFCDGDQVRLKVISTLASYSWSGTHIQSGDSTISVSKTDTIVFSGFDNNNCTYRDTVMTLAHPLPVFDLGKDSTICEQSPIDLVGPPNMKSYDWNNGDGSARVYATAKEQRHILEVVDSNGCESSDDVQIFTKPLSTFSLGPDTSFCEGSTYFINGPGALSDFEWNDTASDLQILPVKQPGTYWLKAYNSFKCPYSDTITLTWRSKPTIDLGPDRGLCDGDEFYLVAPGNMLRYTWFNGSGNDSFLVNAGGLYFVEITDSFGCKNIDSVDVTAYALPTVALGADTTICETDSLLLDPGSGFVAYDWSTGSSAPSIYGKSGTYSVTVTDNNGCKGSGSRVIDTKDCTGSFRELGLGAFKAFPNPVGEVLNLEFTANRVADYELQLVDVNGRIAWKHTMKVRSGTNEQRFNVSTLSSGVYFLHVQNTDGNATLRLIID
jgi:ribosomal protein S11